MIKSMTGFGKASFRDGEKSVSCEIKCVNHRFLDLNCKMGRPNAYIEDKTKKLISEKLARGKVDLYMTYFNGQSDNIRIRPRFEVIASYIEAFEEISSMFDIDNDVRVSTVSRLPNAFDTEIQPDDDEAVWRDYEPVITEALDKLEIMRIAEGKKLEEDLLEKVAYLEGKLAEVEEIVAGAPDRYMQKLSDKIKALLEDRNIDESRILTEAAIFADKTAIDEEIVRLKSHFSQFRSILDGDEPAGRKLDFLVQEMNRETNTIGSKTNELKVTSIVLDMKSTIEKIREQIQNVE